jgi:hypothetical protein
MKKTPVIAAVLFLFISTSINASDAVTRALFTTAIKDHEPVDEIGQLDNTVSKIFFFTEITGLANKTITHRWQHEGKIKAKTKFEIGGDRWRVWSSKKLLPQWVGIWTVTVLDAENNILAEEDMVYIPTDTISQDTAQ